VTASPTNPICPSPDPLVENLIVLVLSPPPGYDYDLSHGQLLFPVYNQNRWRLLLQRRDVAGNGAGREVVPVFLDGDFIRKLSKALNAMQRELNKAASDDFGSPEVTPDASRQQGPA